MVRDTPPSQDASTHRIWNSYLKEYLRYAPDRKRDGQTVRLLYASQSSFGGIKMSNCEKLVLYLSEKVQKIAAIAMLSFGFQWPNNRLKMFLTFPNDQKYPHYLLVLKFNVTLEQPLRLVIRYFLINYCQMFAACIFITANETWDLMWVGSPIQNKC